MAVDGNDKVVLCGYLQENIGSKTVKKVGSDGSDVWTVKIVNRIGVAGEVNGAVYRVAFDGANNPIVTGTADFWGNGYELYAAKLGQDSGTRAWEWHGGWTGTSNGVGSGGVAVDPDNNAVVAGLNFTPYAHLGGGGQDLMAAKINGATGSELWRNVYDAGVNANELEGNVAVSPAGDVFMVGSSQSSAQGSYDIVTRKVDGTGAERWTKRQAGPSDSFAKSVAVTSTGDAISLGYGLIPGHPQPDARLFKYAGADGSILWETSYDGPTSGTETIQSMNSLALGPLGAVAIAPWSFGAVYDWAAVLYGPAPDFDGDGIADSTDPDDDNDGLSDVFEQRYFGNSTAATPAADPDGDGSSTLQEQGAGTNPADPSEVFRISAIGRQGNDMVIGFIAAPDKSYRVISSAEAGGSSPTSVATVPATPTGGVRSVVDPGATLQASRFYRVEVMP